MCRILGYLGPSLPLDRLVLKPEHSMLVQSYSPRELNNAVLNGDGFGLGWHGITRGVVAPNSTDAFVYRNTLPMWNDRSLEDLCRYIQSENFVVNLRSATHKMPLDVSNTQPFKWQWAGGELLFVHNGLIENFFESLYRPIRKMLCDKAYQCIKGLTDSEHIFALLVHYLESQPGVEVAEALNRTVHQVIDMANNADVRVAMNILLSVHDRSAHALQQASYRPATVGHRMFAFRYDNQQEAPSLYSLKNTVRFPNAIIFSSEPLFEGDWQIYPPDELLFVDHGLNLKRYATVS